MNLRFCARALPSAVYRAWLTGALALLLTQISHAQVDDSASVAKAMQTAAIALVQATPAAARTQLVLAFDLSQRSDWHYTPRSRAGIALKDMTPQQRAAARALLQAPLTAPGMAKIEEVMALEIALRAIEAVPFLRVPENYAFALYGDPASDAAWGWRVEGHHLSLHFTVGDGRVVSTLPQFIGANPATVPREIAGAPKAGRRVLGAEEDAARALLASLTPAQRAAAIISASPYGDIVSGRAPEVQPLERAGLAASAMDSAQRDKLMALVETYAAHLKPALAQARLARVRQSAPDQLRFAWAGSVQAGQPHYFRIQGEHFLIEHDNSGGNHVHTVWRDFAGDWGKDVLREHYLKAKGSAHKHR
jgi:hypothetical protein